MSPSSSSTSSIPKPSFKIDEIINNSWKIVKELGSGGCGIVYEVERIRGTNMGMHAAMKAETIDKNYSETLAAEALVLRRMQWSSHFCRIYLAGRPSPNCNIIVMSLVGRSLSWLRRQNPSQRFTLSTAIRLGIQCLEAIKDLHSIGIIHRDVKGSNFAIGQGNLCRTVHMIDFGFARFYLTRGLDGNLHHRNPRQKAPYLGTDRYCSVFVHMRKEQGRRDDLWSFLYMLVEFIVGQLPWRSSPYKNLLSKKLQSEEYLLRNCPLEFYAIFDHIRYLNYSARPNYALITRKLSGICQRKRYALDDPYDWEEGGRYYEEISLQKVDKTKMKTKTKCIIDENNDKLAKLKVEEIEQIGKQQTDEMQSNHKLHDLAHISSIIQKDESIRLSNLNESEILTHNNGLQNCSTETSPNFMH
ncbi:Protein kinase domain family protein [Brugia pahangi]